jgi:hypothetical protein
MTNLKRLVVTLCLMSVLAVTALAGETQSPPCPPPEPGETQCPPCSSAQQVTDDPTPGDIQSPPAAETLVITTIADAAVGVLLSLF